MLSGEKRSRRWTCFLGALAVLSAGFALSVWRFGGPEPPTVPLEGLDPAVSKILRDTEHNVRKNRRSSSAWGQYGMVCLIYEFKSEAATCFDQAGKLDPSDPRWPYFHGLALLPDQTEMALDSLRRAVSLLDEQKLTKNLAPRLRLANILSEIGQYDEAEKHFAEVQIRDPDNAHANLGLGRIAFASGEFDTSLPFLVKAADSPYTARVATQLLVTVYNRIGEHRLAVDAANRLSQLKVDLPMEDPFVEQASKYRVGLRATVDYAGQLLRNGRIAEAKPVAERAIRNYPESTEAWMLWSRVQMREHNKDSALQAAQKAVSLAPEAVEPLIQLGIIHLTRREIDEAIVALQAAKERKPKISEIHHNLGLCYIAQKDWTNAIDAFRKAAELNPGFVDSYLGLAEALFHQGDVSGAERAIQRAQKLAPHDDRVLRILNRLNDGFVPSSDSG